MRHVKHALGAGLALALLTAPLTAQKPVPSEVLDEIRAATEKYQDVAVAEAEGYVDPLNMCVTSIHEGQPAQLGAMGLHYVRPDLLGITGDEPRVDGNGTHTDFTQPAVLVYEPQADGSMKLGAIENLVWAEAWHAAGNEGPPSFHGHDYYYMHDNPETEVDEAHGFEPHYELHFWLYAENPSGMFMPWNPRVTCDNYQMAATN